MNQMGVSAWVSVKPDYLPSPLHCTATQMFVPTQGDDKEWVCAEMGSRETDGGLVLAAMLFYPVLKCS